MNNVMKENDTEAILLVDATNAFNCLNRQAALLNMNIICPEFQKYLINTYRQPPKLYVNGGDGEFIESQEGSTQGDNAGMSMYACGTKPLVDHLRNEAPYIEAGITAPPKQVWMADDSAAAGRLKSLRIWWQELSKAGPYLGYYPQPEKCHLVVKSQELFDQAVNIFHGTGVKITKDGRPYLGSAIGTTAYVRSYVQTKVDAWLQNLKVLSEIAIAEPHAAYHAFVNGVSKRWLYLMRTTSGIDDLFKPLEEAIKMQLIPSLIGRSVTDVEREIFALPTRLRGTAIIKLDEIATRENESSINVTKQLVSLIT